MGNAIFGIPQEYTVTQTSLGAVYPASNMANDEPGLIFKTSNIAASNAETCVLDVDIAAGTDSIGLIAFLGLDPVPGFTMEISSYPTSGDRTSNTSGTIHVAFTDIVLLSTNRSASSGKMLKVYTTPTTNKYFQISIRNPSGVAKPFVAWRMLFCKKIQPPDNIEAGPEISVDDRSDRRYVRTGRRIIDPTVICPAFKGIWPWLDDTQAKQDFRPLLYKRGGTYPVLFALDPDDLVWGEDSVFYGDLEKSMALVPDEAGTWSFSFAIVSIAP